MKDNNLHYLNTKKKNILENPEENIIEIENNNNNKYYINIEKNKKDYFKREVGRKILQKETKNDDLLRILNIENQNLSNKLLIAAEKGDKKAVYLLLNQGLNPNKCIGLESFSPMHYAARRGHLEIGRLLLDFGIFIDLYNSNGETPLHIASFGGHYEFVEFLIDKGADIDAINNDQETPLFYAARRGTYRIVRLLIYYGADIMWKNRFQDTASDEVLNEQTKQEFETANKERIREENSLLFNSISNNKKNELKKEWNLHQRHREIILSFLDVSSIINISKTCSRWHRAADNPKIWKSLKISRWENALNHAVGVARPALNHEIHFQLNLSSSKYNIINFNKKNRPSTTAGYNKIENYFCQNDDKNKTDIGIRPNTARKT